MGVLPAGTRAMAIALPEYQLTVPAASAHDSQASAVPLLSRRRLGALLLALDGLVALASATIAVVSRFRGLPDLEYALLIVALPPVWLVTMAAARAYDRRLLAGDTGELRRVVNGGIWLFAAVAASSFLAHADLSREAVVVAIPLVTTLTLASRLILRRVVQAWVARGAALSRVLVVGTESEVADLVGHMRRTSRSGFQVVGACTDGAHNAVETPGGPIPVLGAVEEAAAVAASSGADTIAVAGSGAVGSGAMRELSWELEHTGVDLVIAPAMTAVAGPRIVVQPVGGLPLLHVDRPTFSGAPRLIKEAIDRVLAFVLLVVLSPVLLAIAAAIKLTSRGPVIFSQERVGLGGRPFPIYKFRTMRHDAEVMRSEVDHLNELDGPLFKIRRDPRLTSLGRWLRRLSLDELPQLVNVLNGTMSLVGPRPPLQSEVEEYGRSAHRRLLVKPGITGLWQVSGRSDLSWDESVRLDLFYVDNWSMRLDCALLWRTLAAVIAGRGAY